VSHKFYHALSFTTADDLIKNPYPQDEKETAKDNNDLARKCPDQKGQFRSKSLCPIFVRISAQPGYETGRRFMERVADEREQWLSERARALLHTVTTWVKHLPDGTVHVTRELFPLDNDYGSELIITLQPEKLRACALTIGVISDTRVPYHFHIGKIQRIAQAEGVTRYWTVPAQAPLFRERRCEVAQDEIATICQAVAEARVTLDLGIIQGILVAIESCLLLPATVRPLHLHGVSGPMGLVKLMRRFGGGQIRPFTVAVWT
jgi:hypothetical protein